MSQPALIPQADLARALKAARQAGFAVVRARAVSGGVEYIFSDGPAMPRGGAGEAIELD